MNGDKEPTIADSWLGDPEICKKKVEHHIVELNALLNDTLEHDRIVKPTDFCSPELMEETFSLLRQIIVATGKQNEYSEKTFDGFSTSHFVNENLIAIENERLAATLAGISDSVFILDENAHTVFLNKSAILLCDIPLKAALGKRIEDLLTFIDEKTMEPSNEVIEKLGKNEENKELRYLLHLKNKEHTVLVKGEPLSGLNGQPIGFMLLLRDITEKELLEEELLKVRKLESVGLLAGGIAHDFNNILTGIITNLFMARMSVINNEEACQLIADAEKAAFKATRLTKQLLTFSQGGAPVKEPLTVGQLIEETVGFSLSGSNVDYKLDFPEDLNAIEADKGQIDQALNNLILNAAQAMPDGGTIYITAENLVLKSGTESENFFSNYSAVPLVDGDYVKISVRDEGAGIPKKHLSKIFDPYFSTKTGSAGLGLTTAYSIIVKHGGYIEVDSDLGKGTTFSCFLPALIEKENSEDTANKQIKITDTCGKVLVMDDDVIIRTVVEKLLKKNGYSVECVSNGTDALTVYRDAFEKSEPFEFVIMDLTIPGGMGGKETVIKLKEFDGQAKVVVFSGYSNDPILTHFAEYGFDGVLKKPFSTEELLHLISSIGARNSTK